MNLIRAFRVTKNCIRLGDIDSTQEVLLSNDVQAKEMARLWALYEFESCVGYNPMWRLEEEDGVWCVFEEDNTKWSYTFAVSELDTIIYDRAVDTEVFKNLPRSDKE